MALNSSISSSRSTISSFSYDPHFSFLSDLSYHQLLDDLQIVGDIDEMCDYSLENEVPDKQVEDLTRNVTLKHKALLSLIQSESQYINELSQFEDGYCIQLREWLEQPFNRNSYRKLLPVGFDDTLDELFNEIHRIKTMHSLFNQRLNQRLQLWGPTQFLSDILSDLYSHLSAYQLFFSHFSRIIVMLDTLYKMSSFNRLIHSCTTKSPTVREFLYYIRLPIYRLSMYSKTISHLINFTDPYHPDYIGLMRVHQSFTVIENNLQERIKDCKSNLAVLEYYHFIGNCCVSVTLDRRLLLWTTLIEIDIDYPTIKNKPKTYILYNDALIYCGKSKSITKDNEKLQFLGTLELANASIKPLCPRLTQSMSEPQKSSLIYFSKKTRPVVPQVPVYGFELTVLDSNVEASFNHGHLTSAIMEEVVIQRRYALRTRSMCEQELWMETLKSTILSVTEKKTRKY
ncbi:Dbl homology domain-containing protein [Spinellus fusiger]|nr:Dbl homology domain-containing protein [Spinellus fusiger]